MSDPTPSDIYSAPRSPVETGRSDGHPTSRLGFVSLVLGIVSALVLFAAIMNVISVSPGVGPPDLENQAVQGLVSGFLALVACAGSLVGLTMAIIALRRPKQAQGRALSGLLLNSVTLLAFALLLMIGLDS